MSDTPRTDEASIKTEAFDTPRNAINFARELERENNELQNELSKLRKDKTRLDWLMEVRGGDLQSREDIDQAICHEHGLPSI